MDLFSMLGEFYWTCVLLLLLLLFYYYYFFNQTLCRIFACFRKHMETKRKLSGRFASTDKQTITLHLSSVLMALLTWLCLQKSLDKKYWLQYLGVFITELVFMHAIVRVICSF